MHRVYLPSPWKIRAAPVRENGSRKKSLKTMSIMPFMFDVRVESMDQAPKPRPLHPASRHRRLPRPSRHSDATDWPRIAALYRTLAETTPSPIIELNRAVAVSMALGPQAGLDIVDTLTSEPSLKNYHLLPSVRGDLLTKLNRLDEARTEFNRAATLTRNTRERDLLLKRANDCSSKNFPL
jgi:hypothetical protein